jgi:hypothetical protein
LEDGGDFFVGEAVEFTEGEDDALVFGEFGEGGLDVEAGIDGGDVSRPPCPMTAKGGGVGSEGFVFTEHADGVFVFTAEEGGLAVADGEEPGFDGGAFLEGAQGAEGGGEGFLYDVFSIVVSSDKGGGEAEKGGGVAVHEAMERIGVAFLGAVHELEIRLFQRFSALFSGVSGGGCDSRAGSPMREGGCLLHVSAGGVVLSGVAEGVVYRWRLRERGQKRRGKGG